MMIFPSGCCVENKTRAAFCVPGEDELRPPNIAGRPGHEVCHGKYALIKCLPQGLASVAIFRSIPQIDEQTTRRGAGRVRGRDVASCGCPGPELCLPPRCVGAQAH